MRNEHVKSSFFINGVEVFDLGVEYVFFAKDRRGILKEWHLAKLNEIQLDGRFGGVEKVDLMTALYAIVLFPNISTKAAVEQYRLLPDDIRKGLTA